jgi:hypothetical protein
MPQQKRSQAAIAPGIAIVLIGRAIATIPSGRSLGDSRRSPGQNRVSVAVSDTAGTPVTDLNGRFPGGDPDSATSG